MSESPPRILVKGPPGTDKTTLARRVGGFIAEMKRGRGVEVVGLSRENRDRLPAELAARLARGE